jgi:hypothetical protein
MLHTACRPRRVDVDQLKSIAECETQSSDLNNYCGLRIGLYGGGAPAPASGVPPSAR